MELESFKLSRSMRKKFIDKRFAVVENSLNVDEDNNDIIDETPMDIDEGEAELSTADHQYWNSNALIENRMFLDENISNLKKISPSFDILYYIGLIISAMKVGSNHCSDYNLPLYQTSKNTKGEFAKSLKSVFEGNLISKVAENEILNCLYTFLGDMVNLPIQLTDNFQSNLAIVNSKRSSHIQIKDNHVKDVEDFEYENAAKSNLDEYCRDTARYIEVDQCINDCFVYAGDENISLMRCPICSEFRYRPCTRSKCPGKKKVSSECEHLLVNDGIPFKQLFYRFLIPLLIDLIETDYFLCAIEYQTDLILRGDESALFYNDFSDGSVAMEHLTSMKLNFDAWVSEDSNRGGSVPVNLLLLQFYDAGQIFKWRHNRFIGHFTGIINLPPSYRGKIGISNFCQALFSGKHASAAEKFIFIDCYCEELRSLYVGYEYIGKNSTRYFIQARLIFHSLDTRGVEPSFGLKSMSNSLFGCPTCRNFHGISDTWKTNFIGHRYFLPEENILRYYGQSGLNSPRGFYNPETDNAWFIKENYLSSTESIFVTDERCSSPHNKHKEYTWSHQNPRFQLSKSLKKLLFFRHFDLRKRCTFGIISKEDYIKSALNAERNGVDVDGIKFLWPFDPLPYGDFPRHYSFPVYHCLASIISTMLEFMIGTYIEKAISKRKYKRKIKLTVTSKGKKSTSKKRKRVVKRPVIPTDQVVPIEKTAVPVVTTDRTALPDISSDVPYVPIYRPSHVGTTPPYSASKNDYLKTIARLSCVLLPEGSSSSYKINIKDIGQLKMEQKVILLTVFWDFIIYSLSSIDNGYKIFYAMFGADIRELLSLRIKKDSVNQLQNDVFESVSVWEAIFPIKACSFQLHELCHLVHSIHFYGSPAILNDLSGERSLQAIKKIKKLTNPGGTSFERMVFRRHIFRERLKMDMFFAAPVNTSVSSSPNHHTKVKFDPDLRVLTHKSFSFHILEEKTESFQCVDVFSRFEINQLVKVLLLEVRKNFLWDEQKCLSSPIYCIAKHISAVDFYAKFQHVLKTDKYSEEFRSVSEEILNMKPISYRRAMVYGVPFKGRGMSCRETELPSDIRYGAEEKIQKQCLSWWDKKEYSCWCRFSQQTKRKSNNNVSRYAQINSFFKLNLSSDPVLQNLLVASITAYECISKEGIDTVAYQGALDKRKFFVSLQDIHPTQIATIPFTNDDFVLSKRFSGQFGKFVKYFGKNAPVKFYVMLIMQPENLSLYPELRSLSLQKN